MCSEITLTETDLLILESYKHMIDGLGKYLGSGYEIILHNLGSFDHSVIAIQNGHYTGRKIGSPITDKALEMLEAIRNNSANDCMTYFTMNRDGKPMKSTTIAIRGEQNNVIGLLCINFYLDIPFSSLLMEYTSYNSSNTTLRNESVSANLVAEEFSEKSDDLINHLINVTRKQVYVDDNVPSANKNRVIIQKLRNKGVFNFKDAVIIVAKTLNISKNTVYLHLRNTK